ncbi:MAG TPA: chloride channel protein, partial [Acidimicrobiales bacterium]|nr:chloride channel protein [Acidimicrobiales bacterium]
LGLVVAAAALRTVGQGVSPATSDEYIRAFHDDGGDLRPRQAVARVIASIATLGSGGPMGYEGPSLYAGASIGAALERRISKVFNLAEPNVLLVCGAAAGVAAIFKAPVTGLVFALEVPYQDDVARHMLLPAAISSATSYLVFAALAGTEPILPVAGRPPFNFVDLGGAAVIGLVCGLLARAFIVIIREAKRLSSRGHPALRIGIAGGVLGSTVLLGHVLSAQNLVLGPGYGALTWALNPNRAIVALIVLGTLRVAGTAAVVGGGGAGGLFIPLVIQGALVGRAVGGLFEAQTTSLFPVVGMAAFLGAGYRVPLAAVVFVAEFTGRPGFVVPGLIAAVVAQLVMGRSSISAYQSPGRVGNLEQRLRLPVTTALDLEARVIAPTETVDAVFSHLLQARQQSVVVVDGDRYCGLVEATDLAHLDRGEWATTCAADVMRSDVPTAQPSWTASDAVRAMDDAGVDRLAVCDGDRYVGVVAAADIVRLGELVTDRRRRH